MAEHREVRYATPSLTHERTSVWDVSASPWGKRVGHLEPAGELGWTAITRSGHYAGLWPTKQAAAEVLVKQAGYELGEVGR